jgi:uncharacterized protein (TIGR02265 family)
MLSDLPTDWSDPPWDAPLDTDAALAAIPESATMKGMFLAGLVEAAKQGGVTLPSARDRYVPFRPYPLREHAQLLLETGKKLWPDLSTRQALRKLGRGATRVVLQSIVGRVMVGSVEAPIDVLRAMAKAYPVSVEPSHLEVFEAGDNRAVVRLRDVHHFLDSHNVGVFEGALHHAGVVDGRVRVHSYSRKDADFECTWKHPWNAA